MMKYHFENKKGWMNDPNGLVYFKGKYHAFFQHYPYAPRWGQMHWGHAVSEDLINWEELDIALYPDMPYESDGGCFSGSAIVKDDRLYLFYTSVSHEMKQTQSMAYSDDGINFVKFSENPIIKESPLGDNSEFRDPKVFEYYDEKQGKSIYKMVVGSGSNGEGKILLFESEDLLKWKYIGELLSDMMFAPCVECPNLFKLNSSNRYADVKLPTDRYVLMFSTINHRPGRVCFAVGDFDGEKFVFDGEYRVIELGEGFYAPQEFEAPDGRRIVIGWIYNNKQHLNASSTHIGAFSLPREITIDKDDNLYLNPIKEADFNIKTESDFVVYEDGLLKVVFERKILYQRSYATEPDVKVFEDVGLIEVFLNDGKENITVFLC